MNAAASCGSCIHLMFLVYLNIYIADAMSISLLVVRNICICIAVIQFVNLQTVSTMCYIDIAVVNSYVVGRVVAFLNLLISFSY